MGHTELVDSTNFLERIMLDTHDIKEEKMKEIIDRFSDHYERGIKEEVLRHISALAFNVHLNRLHEFENYAGDRSLLIRKIIKNKIEEIRNSFQFKPGEVKVDDFFEKKDHDFISLEQIKEYASKKGDFYLSVGIENTIKKGLEIK